MPDPVERRHPPAVSIKPIWPAVPARSSRVELLAFSRYEGRLLSGDL